MDEVSKWEDPSKVLMFLKQKFSQKRRGKGKNIQAIKRKFQNIPGHDFLSGKSTECLS